MGYFDSQLTKNQKKDVELTEQLLEELPDNFIGCRDLRHAWSIENDFFVYNNPTNNRLLMVSRELACMRCDTKRREVFVQRKYGLEKIRNIYTYADGYKLKGVPRGVKPAVVVHDVLYKKAMQKVAAAASKAAKEAG